jgi:hypothetical protein
MKKLAIATAVLAFAATATYAGSYVEPVMEAPVIIEETSSSSSGGLVIPLLLLLLVVAAVAANN